jgi:uncharacterized membrane protein YeaQ/YmgE (transglycosylase-associated protein family)
VVDGVEGVAVFFSPRRHEGKTAKGTEQSLRALGCWLSLCLGGEKNRYDVAVAGQSTGLINAGCAMVDSLRRPLDGRKEIVMLWFLVVGIVAGFLAGKIMRGKGFGILGDLVVGIIGAMLGGWLFGVLGIHAGGLIGSIITATVGAVLLVVLVRAIF